MCRKPVSRGSPFAQGESPVHRKALDNKVLGVYNKKAPTQTVDAEILKMVGMARIELATFSPPD